MSRSDPLVWQGAAGRTPAEYLPLRVSRVHKDGGGLFGIGNAQSLVGALPDARIIEGAQITPTGDLVKVRVPGGELPPGLVPGARLVLGLVDADHVICLLLPPTTITDDALQSWATTQSCG